PTPNSRRNPGSPAGMGLRRRLNCERRDPTGEPFFFQIHDPTTLNRQGDDIGLTFRSAIFYLDEEQRRIAGAVIMASDASGLWPGKLVTEVVPCGTFWEAEPEYQNYLGRHPDAHMNQYVRKGWKLP
ncbi:peptide-methionine (S)-S-oxide reductase, partial [Streptomyces sp. NPDC055722]